MYVRALIAVSATLFSSVVTAVSFDGSIEFEQRLFESGKTADDINVRQNSVKLSLEFFKDWNDGQDQIVFEPFIRLDADDSDRSHVDARQLLWTHYGENHEFSAGLGQIYWGVTESQHLVDIINQTDAVENIDGEDKLGQAMLHYSYIHDYGTVDAFLLPSFRERTFEGPSGRLNAGLTVDQNSVEYESSDGQSNLDYALRYSHTLGDWDIGLSWFEGTSREPDLLRFANASTGETLAYYPQLKQLGTDLQLTTGSWIYKLEAVHREFNDAFYDNYFATTIGTEYTLVGLFGSSKDLGLLVEYSWDQRDQLASSLFQNDAFIGARLAFNDALDSQILFGISNDLDNNDNRLIFIEGATRLGNNLTLNAELRIFNASESNTPLARIDDDSFIQIGLEYFFD